MTELPLFSTLDTDTKQMLNVSAPWRETESTVNRQKQSPLLEMMMMMMMKLTSF